MTTGVRPLRLSCLIANPTAGPGVTSQPPISRLSSYLLQHGVRMRPTDVLDQLPNTTSPAQNADYACSQIEKVGTSSDDMHPTNPATYLAHKPDDRHGRRSTPAGLGERGKPQDARPFSSYPPAR